MPGATSTATRSRPDPGGLWRPDHGAGGGAAGRSPDRQRAHERHGRPVGAPAAQGARALGQRWARRPETFRPCCRRAAATPLTTAWTRCPPWASIPRPSCASWGRAMPRLPRCAPPGRSDLPRYSSINSDNDHSTLGNAELTIRMPEMTSHRPTRHLCRPSAFRRHSRVGGAQDRGPAGGLVRLRRGRPRLAPGGKHHAFCPGHGAAGGAGLRHPAGGLRGDHQPRAGPARIWRPWPTPRPRMWPSRTTCTTARCSTRPRWSSRRRWRWRRPSAPAARSCWRHRWRATRSASASASSSAARTTRCSTPPAPPARWHPPRPWATCWGWTRRRCSMPSARPAPSRRGCGSSCARPPTASSCTRPTPPPPA